VSRCKDCVFFRKCEWLLAHSFDPDSTECDWDPTRFRQMEVHGEKQQVDSEDDSVC